MINLKISSILLLILFLSCQVKNRKNQNKTPTTTNQQQLTLQETTENLNPNGFSSSLSELEIGIPGDDSRSESLRFERQANGSLNVILMRSADRVEEQQFINSVNLDIGNYDVQTVDLLGNGRNEALLIGNNIAQQKTRVYILGVNGYNGRVVEIFSLDLTLDSSVNIEWEKEGFYFAVTELIESEEKLVFYRWNESQQSFIASSLQNNQPSSSSYDARMQRILARDSAYMLSSLSGFWRWVYNDEATQALIHFIPEEELMEVYISSKTGDKFLPGERSLSRFQIDKTSFFFDGRISLKLLNFYIAEMQRWLSVRYIDYDNIVIASSMNEPWLGSYQRLNEADYTEEIKQLKKSKKVEEVSLSGEFRNDGFSLKFDQGRVTIRKNNSSYDGIYVFLLHSGIYILQYRAVNKEEQRKEEGLYRIEVDRWPQPKQLALIPLSQLGQQIAGAAVLRLVRVENA